MTSLNAAQQIHQYLGIAIRTDIKTAHASQNERSTKSGPGRYHAGGKPGNRISKARPQRAYVALMAAWASKRVTKAALRDDHGAITLIGKPYALEGVHPTTREVVLEGWVDGDDFGYTVQRKWLGGISAQRGY